MILCLTSFFYALTAKLKGYQVDYIEAESTVSGLRQHIHTWQPDQMVTMAATEYWGRHFQKRVLANRLDIPVNVVPNTQFLVDRYNPTTSKKPGKRVVMENFYRSMRRHFDVLMEHNGDPVGGQWNYDKENRKPLPKGGLESPVLPIFEPDQITDNVIDTVNSLDHGIGSTTGFNLAVTHEQAQYALDDFIANRLSLFGPYEDAMSQENAHLFHSILAPYFNIGLLDPLEAVRQAEQAYHDGVAPTNSVEGFVRQVLGWREYIYWQYWQQMPDLLSANSWQHSNRMPQLFWDGKTEMNCLHHVVQRVIEDGYSHHIERLMVICNFCMLAGIDPALVNKWFLTFYIDAYEWVVTPNVIGMGLNADGGKTATKPYIASANYINKMGDYCKGCQYNPKKRTGADACPFNFLYWNFLLQHEEKLRKNPRLGPAVLGLRHLDAEERMAVGEQAADFLDHLTYYA